MLADMQDVGPRRDRHMVGEKLGRRRGDVLEFEGHDIAGLGERFELAFVVIAAMRVGVRHLECRRIVFVGKNYAS